MRYLRRWTNLLVIGAALSTSLAHAATYYIDYSGGSDSNKGNDKTAAWKRHPYMKGFAGAYAHSAGDRFIFKGGVTWPVTVFQLRIIAGGSGDTNRDYYGVDQTWFQGDSWSRPLFDFQNTLIGTGWWSSAGVNIDNANYITVDGLELANHRAPLITATVGNWGTCSLLLNSTTSYITVTNCVIRDWDMPMPITAGSDGGGGIYYVGGGGGNGVVVSGCVLHQAGTAVKCGRSLSIFGEVAYTEIHDTPNGIIGSGNLHDNHIYNIVNPVDPASHPNAIETFGPSRIYGNLIHNLGSGVAAILLNPDWSGGYGVDLVYNNVIFNCGNQAPIQLDTGGLNPGLCGLRAYNNTLEHGATYCIRVSNRVPTPYAILDVRNNHLLTTGSPYLYNNPAMGGGNVASVTIVNNLVQSQAQATAAGYLQSSYYATSSGTAPTVNTGLDLSSSFNTDIRGSARPASAWDIGAYEYAGSTPKTKSPPVISPVQTTTSDASSDPGLQVQEGATVTLTAAITDAEGDPLTWNWSYSVDGGPENTFSSGSGGDASSTYTYPAGSGGRSFVWTLRANDGSSTSEAQFMVGVLTPTALGTNFEAELGLVQSPMQIENGYLVQYTQAPLASSGRATYNFTVPESGDYTIVGMVDAPSDGSNSFYVNIDAEPQDPYSVWHIALTSGFERRTVSWQGDGTWDRSAFVPKYFNLAAGAHQLIVVGRESGVKLDRIMILKSPAPPKNLRIASGS